MSRLEMAGWMGFLSDYVLTIAPFHWILFTLSINVYKPRYQSLPDLL